MNLPQWILKRGTVGAQTFVLPSAWKGDEVTGAVEAIMDHEATQRTEEPGSLRFHASVIPALDYLLQISFT